MNDVLVVGYVLVAFTIGAMMYFSDLTLKNPELCTEAMLIVVQFRYKLTNNFPSIISM